MTHITELGATVPFTEIPQLLSVDIGRPVTASELLEGQEGLSPADMLGKMLVDLSWPEGRDTWRDDVRADVGEALRRLTYFYEGTISRTDTDILWQQRASRVEDTQTQRGLGYLTSRLLSAGGVHAPHHIVRNDQEPEGTRVTAARIGGRDCYFIESTVGIGVGAATNRRLEVYAAEHPGLAAAVNAYSYTERAQVKRLLEQIDTTPEMRETVLAVANREVAPDTEALHMLVKEAAAQQATMMAAEQGSDETEVRERLLGAAVMDLHPKVLV